MRCKDRVAIVTGAAGNGIGRSIALTLAREGAAVAVNYRTSEAAAERIVGHIKSRGGEAAAFRADVFEAAGCEGLVEAVTGRLGRVDICVVNPGAGWHPEPVDRLDSAGAIEDVVREVGPVLNLMPLVLPGMYERRWGRIVGIGLLPPYESPAYAYNVAKAARAEALLRMCDEAWEYGVTMNVVGPGPVSEIASFAEAVEQCEQGPAWRERANVSPQDVAEGVAFLCSDAGRFVTGCVLPLAYQRGA